MRALGVVPEQPVKEFVVECLEIGEQELFVVVEKLILQRAIEALTARVHFGCSRERMPLGDPCGVGGLGELSGELRAVIMKCVLDTHRQHRNGLAHVAARYKAALRIFAETCSSFPTATLSLCARQTSGRRQRLG